MARTYQFQFFCNNSSQSVAANVGQSLANLLVGQADALKSRSFNSEQVKEYLFEKLDGVTQYLNDNHTYALNTSKYMVFPFKAIAVPENLQKEGYVRSMLDTLSVLAFTDAEYDILDNHVNVRIEGKNIFGVYFTDGNLKLKDSYIRLLKSMVDSKVHLPSGFVSIPLDTQGEYALDQDKIPNIVTSIVGDSGYIKQLSLGQPRCVSLSSYILDEAETVDEAKSHVREVLGLE